MDLNLVVNVATLVVGLVLAGVFGPRAFKAKQASADLAEKDRTIETHKQTITAMETAAVVRDRECERWRTQAAEAIEKARVKSEIAAGFQARYEEQSKYTAKEALRTLEQAMVHQSNESERRHVELMEAMRSMSDLLGDRRTNARRRIDDPPIP